MQNNIDEIENKINQEDEIVETNFDINYIENSSGKIMNLINNVDEFEYELKISFILLFLLKQFLLKGLDSFLYRMWFKRIRNYIYFIW